MGARRVGEPVVLREVWAGRLWSARPATVVRDDAELVALYLAPGAAWVRAWEPGGPRKRLPIGEWELRELTWPTSCLRLHRPGAHHDVLIFWTPDHARITHWYVNLQTPLRRTTRGFDYTDLVLDAVVSGDRAGWRWEDEEELAEALTLGLLAEERAAFLRAEGEAAAEAVRARRAPYDDRWEGWRPDPGWAVPTLPRGWAQV